MKVFALLSVISSTSFLAVVRGQDPLCRTGIFGPFGLVAGCCDRACGTCGGPGCDTRPGGPNNCCGTTIFNNNRSCDIFNPPCTIQRDPDCITGLPNRALGLCCAQACGTCGGTEGDGCESRFLVGDPSTAGRCCTENIRSNNRPCANFAPPCFLPVPVPVQPAAPACNPITCPANSTPNSNDGCLDLLDECRCDNGFVKNQAGNCVPACTAITCPANSIPNSNDGCLDSLDECRCNNGFVKNQARNCDPVPVPVQPADPVCQFGQDCWYDKQCAFNAHYKTCLGKKYTRAQCYGHYRNQCDGRTRYGRHLQEVEGGSRVLAAAHAECMTGDYNMFLVMKGAHMSGLATPVQEDSACPNVLFHSNVEIEGGMTKSILTIEQDGVAEIGEDQKLHLGTESLASIVAAFENADVSKKGEKAYDAVTNNCVVLLRNMADPLNIPVDKRMIGFVSKRLLAESADHMVDLMKKSPAFSAIVGSGGRFLKGVEAEEIVSKVIGLYV